MTVNRLGVFPGRPAVEIQVDLSSTEEDVQPDLRTLADLPLLIAVRRVEMMELTNFPRTPFLRRVRGPKGVESGKSSHNSSQKESGYAELPV